MSTNAMWWAYYTDLRDGNKYVLSLSSPDLVNPKAARRRAADIAKARLTKKGRKVHIYAVRCVG